MNEIKEEFFHLHHGKKVYHLYAYDNQIFIENSPDIKEILELMESSIEYHEFKKGKNRRVKILGTNALSKLTNDQIRSLLKIDYNKADYLNYLFSLHNSSEKLIPIIESIGNKKEESLIFRIKCANNEEYAVWENVNPKRAAYVFRLGSKHKTLKSILAFISEDSTSKRSYLRDNHDRKIKMKRLGLVDFIDHKGIIDFRKKLRTLCGEIRSIKF